MQQVVIAFFNVSFLILAWFYYAALIGHFAHRFLVLHQLTNEIGTGCIIAHLTARLRTIWWQ